MLVLLYSATSKVKSVEKAGVDILSSLFGETTSDNRGSAPSQTVDGCEHSLSLFHFCCSQLQSNLLSALVRDDKLVIVVKINSFSFLKVYHTSSSCQFVDHQLPVFSEPCLFQQEIGSFASKPSNRLVSACVAYQPVLSLVFPQSCGNTASLHAGFLSSTTDVFFRQLFGLELSLARSTVVIVGTQSGPILFFDIRGYCNPPCSSGTLSNTLCNLDQPVVAIHTLHLPTHREELDGPMSAAPANALLVVGKMGKLVLLSEAEKEKQVPVVSVFHIPGPILSSVLVEGHSFSYSNTRGIHRVCLEPSCISKSIDSDTIPSASVVVPHLQFQSPLRIAPMAMSFITGASPQSLNQAFSATTVGIDGKLFRFHLKSCQDTEKVSEKPDIGREMKEKMNSIKNTADNTSKFQSQLKVVDTALRELNKALSVLLSIKSGGCVFSCSVSPLTERVGVDQLALFAEVELTYTGAGRLQRGWTLLVSTQCTTSAHSQFVTLSLAGLYSNNTIRHRVELEIENRLPSTFCITATLCYSPTHLHSISTQLATSTHSNSAPFSLLPRTGVSIKLTSTVFDALDFVQPHTESTPNHVHHTSVLPLSSDASHTQQSRTFEVILPCPTTESTGGCVSTRRCRDILNGVLPSSVIEAALTESGGVYQVQACGYDGSMLSFELRDQQQEGSCLRLTSRGSVSTSVEVISSICRRLHDQDMSASTAKAATLLQVSYV